MNKQKSNDILALAVLLLWISGVCMLLLGIWLPSWQWALTGVLALVVGTVGTLAVDE